MQGESVFDRASSAFVEASPDGKLLAGGDKTIRFWDPLAGKSHGDCSAFPKSVEAVAFARDSKTVAAADADRHETGPANVG
jgi:WD40 repeat protein